MHSRKFSIQPLPDEAIARESGSRVVDQVPKCSIMGSWNWPVKSPACDWPKDSNSV
jgi:hypothetical protein